jgi:cell division protein FtsQ
MRTLKPAARRKDPAPSRLAYRVKRNWRSGRLRRAITVWLPALVLLSGAGWIAAQEKLRLQVVAGYEEMREDLSTRPEFAIERLSIRGAPKDLEAELRKTLSRYIGTSSLLADTASIRTEVKENGWVRRARVRLSAPETLIVSVEMRVPVVIWRMGESLTLLDAEGEWIAPLQHRADRPDLPVIAGEGADKAVEEAQSIIEAAGPISDRLRGLVRVGERRWDMILHDGPKVMLPGDAPLDAVGYFVSLDEAQEVSERDVAQIDLRLMSRPTLRLKPDALETLKQTRAPKAPGKDA